MKKILILLLILLLLGITVFYYKNNYTVENKKGDQDIFIKNSNTIEEDITEGGK